MADITSMGTNDTFSGTDTDQTLYRSTDTSSVMDALDQAARRASQKRREMTQALQRARNLAPNVEEIALVKRLRREVEMLSHSNAWTILGIPRSSNRQTIQSMGQRMLAHYHELESHRHSEVRRLAANICTRVEAAMQDLLRAPEEGPSILEDPAFQQAVALVGRSDWAQADRYLSALHKKHLDSPPVLAWLGWVRYHNPNRPAADRREEARELLLLALQWDEGNAQANYFLARILAEAGDAEAAERHVQRALKSAPDHVEARNLAIRLRRP